MQVGCWQNAIVWHVTPFNTDLSIQTFVLEWIHIFPQRLHTGSRMSTFTISLGALCGEAPGHESSFGRGHMKCVVPRTTGYYRAMLSKVVALRSHWELGAESRKNTADVDTQCCSSLVLYADRVEWTVFEYAGLNKYITEFKLPYLFFLLFLLILLLLLTLFWFIETGSLVAEDGLKLIIKLKMTWVLKPVCLVYVVLETNPRLWGC